MPQGTVAVVLNFEDADATLACVSSLLHEVSLIAVVVVDNGSDDIDVGRLRTGLESHNPWTELVLSECNRGFGAGMNIGIRKAISYDPDSIFLLNNDTKVCSGAVPLLRDVLFRDETVGVALPVVTTGDGDRVWAAGGWIDHKSLVVTPYSAESRNDLDLTRLVNFIPGAAFLVRPEVLYRVGGFAEGFFLYLEDVELSMRVTDAGFSIELARDAEVWHAVQGGNRSRTYGSIYFRVRNGLWLTRGRADGSSAVRRELGVLKRGLRLVVQKAGAHPGALARALYHYARGVRDGFLQRSPNDLLQPARMTPRESGAGEAVP